MQLRISKLLSLILLSMPLQNSVCLRTRDKIPETPLSSFLQGWLAQHCYENERLWPFPVMGNERDVKTWYANG